MLQILNDLYEFTAVEPKTSNFVTCTILHATVNTGNDKRQLIKQANKQQSKRSEQNGDWRKIDDDDVNSINGSTLNVFRPSPHNFINLVACTHTHTHDFVFQQLYIYRHNNVTVRACVSETKSLLPAHIHTLTYTYNVTKTPMTRQMWLTDSRGHGARTGGACRRRGRPHPLRVGSTRGGPARAVIAVLTR